MNTPTPQSSLPSFVDVVAVGLSRFAGMPETMATALAMSIATSAAEQGYGGTDYYLPVITSLTRAERNARIRSEWNDRNGRNYRNIQHLMRKWGIGRTTLYRIVARPHED